LFVGEQQAKLYHKQKTPVEKQHLFVFADDMSSAVQEPEIQRSLHKFRELFSDDAWQSLLKLGSTLSTYHYP